MTTKILADFQIFISVPLILNSKHTNFGIVLESLFLNFEPFLAFLSAFIANSEHVFVYQFSWIDLNTLFREMGVWLSGYWLSLGNQRLPVPVQLL